MSNLLELLNKIHIVNSIGNLNIQIEGVTDDSREVKNNYAFVCMPKNYESEYARWTYRTDGHDYIPNAIENGATAIVIQKPLSDIKVVDGITFIQVQDAREAISRMSAEFYGNPSQKLLTVGVTGTNGKTSTCYLIRSIFSYAGIEMALLGTIVQRIGDKEVEANMTTIEAPRLQKILKDIVDAGLNGVVMEVSSHAIELKRVDDVKFDVAVFTNLTQDHLDFHKGIEGYLGSKTKLFRNLKGHAIINADDPASEHIIRNTDAQIITYAINEKADIKVMDYQTSLNGLRLLVSVFGKSEVDINLGLLGEYNVYNALSAIGVGISQGLGLDVIKKGLEKADIVPGRFQNVSCGQEFTVIVDYAHTPDALQRVLVAAKKLTKGRLITVFGCGGDRDKGKRPLMGKVASELSDYTIVTSDNPRSENPMDIIDQIKAGIENNKYEVIPDRRLAIKKAIEIANSDDFIVIAGKGHENYQLIKGEKLHFDDREVACEYLRSLNK